MIRRYEDFEVIITMHGDQPYADLGTAPGGHHLTRPIPITLPNDHIAWTEAYQGRKTESELAELGHRLFTAIFVGDLAEKWHTCLAEVERETAGLRLRFSVQAGALPPIPLELLCRRTQPTHEFLALDPTTPVVRSPRHGGSVKSRTVTMPLRMLVVVSNPGLQVRIDPYEQRELLDEGLSSLIAGKKLMIDDIGLPGSPEADYDTLHHTLFQTDYPYDIVHIICHGGRPSADDSDSEGVLLLVDRESGLSETALASDVAGLLAYSGVRLVVLQACEGAYDGSAGSLQGVAQQLIAHGLPAVLAMHCRVDRDVVTRFCKQFYDFWLNRTGLPVEHAVTEARRSVRKHYRRRTAAWAMPVLFIREEGTEVLKIQPERPLFSTQLKRGNILLERGEIDEAVEELAFVHDVEADLARASLARALTAQAQMRLHQGDEDGALQACEQALWVKPGERTAAKIRAAILALRGGMKSDVEIEHTMPSKLENDDVVCKDGLSRPSTQGWPDGHILDERYEVIRRIRTTGFCEIYQARELRFARRLVAVKRLMPDEYLRLQTDLEVEQIHERFEREIAVLSEIEHPSVLRLLDDGGKLEKGNRYFVTEFADKGSLADYLLTQPGGRLRPVEAVRIARSACQGIDVIHQLGIVHRDIKPGNIFLFSESDGGVRVRLADFSIASVPPAWAETTVTLPGSFMGSPPYAAPEQLLESRLGDPRLDLYAWGVTFFEMLTGESFAQLLTGESAEKLVPALWYYYRTSTEDEPPSSLFADRDLPRELVTILRKALRKDPGRRYQSARELRQELDLVLSSLVYAQGASFQSRQQWQAAAKAFEELLEIDPHHGGLDIAAILEDVRSKQRLQQEYSRILHLLEHESWTAILQSTTDLDPAYQEPGGESIGDIRRRALYAQAKKLEANEPERAYYLFYELYRLDPGYGDVAKRCAEAAYQSGADESMPLSWQQIEEWFKRVVEVDPTHFEACYRLGRALREKGDLEGAIEQLTIIPPQVEQFSHAQDALADIFDERGDAAFRKWRIAEAIRHWRKSLRFRARINAEIDED